MRDKLPVDKPTASLSAGGGGGGAALFFEQLINIVVAKNKHKSWLYLIKRESLMVNEFHMAAR